MKTTIALILVLMTGMPVVAQTYRGSMEFSASYGISSFQQTVQTLKIGQGSFDTKVTDGTGAIFVSCRSYLVNNWSLGLAFGSEDFNTSSYDVRKNGEKDTAYRKDKFSYKTLAAEITANYLNRYRVRLYTVLGAGYSFYTVSTSQFDSVFPWREQTYERTSLNVQYVPLGIAYGGRFSIFAEFGLGYKGAVHGGLSYRFDQW